MTREQYLEMCEMLGDEPREEDIPIEFVDLQDEVQEAFQVYSMLQDNIDSMNGVYLGKVKAGILDIFTIMEVADPKTCYQIIQLIDSERASILNAKHKNKPAK